MTKSTAVFLILAFFVLMNIGYFYGVFSGKQYISDGFLILAGVIWLIVTILQHKKLFK